MCTASFCRVSATHVRKSRSRRRSRPHGENRRDKNQGNEKAAEKKAHLQTAAKQRENKIRIKEGHRENRTGLQRARSDEIGYLADSEHTYFLLRRLVCVQGQPYFVAHVFGMHKCANS